MSQGLGTKQLECAIGTFCTLVHTRAVGSWKWANTACSRGSPCRLWRRISDGPKLSLFSEECPLEYLPFWIELVSLEMTEFQLKESKGINGLVGQEESSRAGPCPSSLETLASALLYCPQVEAEMAAHLLSEPSQVKVHPGVKLHRPGLMSHIP